MDCGGEGSHGPRNRWKVGAGVRRQQGTGQGLRHVARMRGVAVTIVARAPETLEAAGEEIHAQTGAKVVAVAADITTEEG